LYVCRSYLGAHGNTKSSGSSRRRRWTHIYSFTWTGIICLRSCTSIPCPPNSLSSRASSFKLVPIPSFNRFPDPTCASSATQKGAREPPWEDIRFKWIDRHEVRTFANFFRDTRVPILNFDEYALAVIISRVTHVKWETWIPKRWSGSATNMAGCKLTCNLFDDIVQWVISEVAGLEHLPFPKLSMCRMYCLLWTVIPTHSYPQLTSPCGFLRRITFEHLSNDRLARIVRITEMKPIRNADSPASVHYLVNESSVFCRHSECGNTPRPFVISRIQRLRSARSGRK